MVTGRRFSRIASTIKGSAMTHLRGRVGEKELTSGGPRVSSAEAGHPEISSAHCAVKRVIKLWERILLRRPFHDGCPTGSTGTRRHDHLHERPLMGRVAHIEGLWWQFSLTERGLREPSAVGLLRISRDRDGGLELRGRSWQKDGSLSARYWSEAAKGVEGAFGRLLLLEGRTAPRPERAAFGRDGGNQDGVRRPRGRVLHDSCGNAPQSERADGRCFTGAPIQRT